MNYVKSKDYKVSYNVKFLYLVYKLLFLYINYIPLNLASLLFESRKRLKY